MVKMAKEAWYFFFNDIFVIDNKQKHMNGKIQAWEAGDFESRLPTPSSQLSKSESWSRLQKPDLGAGVEVAPWKNGATPTPKKEPQLFWLFFSKRKGAAAPVALLQKYYTS